MQCGLTVLGERGRRAGEMGMENAGASPDAAPAVLAPAEVVEASDLLERSPMFRRCRPEGLKALAAGMAKVVFSRGEDIVEQGQVSDRFFVMSDGYARRLRKEDDGVSHYVDTKACGTTISALHVAAADPVYATARCVTQSCTAYAMSRDAFRAYLRRDPDLAEDVIVSLAAEQRNRTKFFRTPLLAQRTEEVNYSAVTIAATMESYYRSALNSLLNQRLSGVASPLFPNMHVQVPTRIMYVNGFKGLRALFDREIAPDSYGSHASRTAVRFATMILPGIVMTPISSVLEACNVGHANSEPLHLRSLRGTLPRGGREVIFGVGLNQLSDYFEERYRTVTSSPLIATSAGSLTAGVVSGYFSHVPHNLSTYKLLNPQMPYSELFKMFVDKSVPDHLIPSSLPKSMLPAAKGILACLFPRGVLVRTVQICGSFAILNGLYYDLFLEDYAQFPLEAYPSDRYFFLSIRTSMRVI